MMVGAIKSQRAESIEYSAFLPIRDAIFSSFEIDKITMVPGVKPPITSIKTKAIGDKAMIIEYMTGFHFLNLLSSRVSGSVQSSVK